MSRLEVRVEIRDCAKLVKVVIEKLDDRIGERIMQHYIELHCTNYHYISFLYNNIYIYIYNILKLYNIYIYIYIYIY